MQRNLSIGSKINEWTIISNPFFENDKEYYYLKCKCGKEEIRSRRSLERPNFAKACRSCGQLRRRVEDRVFKIGMKVQNLEILSYTKNVTNTDTLYKVKCNCGHIFITGHATLSNKIKGRRLPYCNNCFNTSFRKPKRNTMLSKNISLSIYKRLIREAARRGIKFELSVEYLQNLYNYQKGKCIYTGLDIVIGKSLNSTKDRIENTASLDRIDSLKGYIENNVQWIHKDINYMKFNFTTEKFLYLCKIITENHANFEPNFSNSNLKVEKEVQRLDIEELEANKMSKSVQQPLYKVEDIVRYSDENQRAK